MALGYNSFMKKYLIDFFSGLVLGLIFFFSIPLLFGKNPLFLEFQYYLLSIPPFLIFTITPYFRNQLKGVTNKNIFVSKTLFVFLLGFFVPIFTWGFVIYKAASNWTLF